MIAIFMAQARAVAGSGWLEAAPVFRERSGKAVQRPRTAIGRDAKSRLHRAHRTVAGRLDRRLVHKNRGQGVATETEML